MYTLWGKCRLPYLKYYVISKPITKNCLEMIRRMRLLKRQFLVTKNKVSINQSIFWTRLSLEGRGGSSSSWSLQASRSSATKDRCSAGMPRRDQLRSSTSSRHRVLGRPLGLRPIGVEQSCCLAVLSWDIRVTCPYQRSCDLSSRRSSASLFRDSQISALLTLSNKVKPPILRKNPFRLLELETSLSHS